VPIPKAATAEDATNAASYLHQVVVSCYREGSPLSAEDKIMPATVITGTAKRMRSTNTITTHMAPTEQQLWHMTITTLAAYVCLCLPMSAYACHPAASAFIFSRVLPGAPPGCKVQQCPRETLEVAQCKNHRH